MRLIRGGRAGKWWPIRGIIRGDLGGRRHDGGGGGCVQANAWVGPLADMSGTAGLTRSDSFIRCLCEKIGVCIARFLEGAGASARGEVEPIKLCGPGGARTAQRAGDAPFAAVVEARRCRW